MWQVLQMPVTGICVWFQVVVEKSTACGEWQEPQLTVVGMCVAILPVADVPLWQLVQTVAVV